MYRPALAPSQLCGTFPDKGGFIRNIGQVSGTAFPSDLMEFEKCCFFKKTTPTRFQYRNTVLVAIHPLTVLNINIRANG